MTRAQQRSGIAVVAQSLRMGGAERVARDQTELLATRWSTRIITLEAPETDFFDPPESCARLSVPEHASTYGTLRFLRNELTGAALVIAHVNHVALWTLLALVGGRKPPIVVVEHANPEISPPGLWRRIVRRMLYRSASEVVVVNANAAAWFESHTSLRPLIIPNDPPARPELPDIGAERPIDILSLGRLVPVKDIGMLIDALARPLLADTQLRVVVAGDGPDRNRLIAQAEKRGVTVEFIGAVTDPERLYRQAKVVVIPSRFEAHPLVALEAMSEGCVPVGFRDALDDVVQDGVTGALVDCHEPKALAQRISDLLSSPDVLQALASNAATRVFERQSSGAQQWVSLVERLTSLSPGEDRRPAQEHDRD